MSRVQGQHNSHKRNNASQPPKIVIVQQPPPFVFSDEWFGVSLDLSSSYPADVPTPYIELCANLHRLSDKTIMPEPAQDNNIVDLHIAVQSSTNTATADARNSTVVKCKIKSPLSEDNKPVRYCLKFYYRSRQTGSVLDEVEQVCSIPGE